MNNITTYSIISANYQSALNLDYDCIPGAFANAGLHNFNIFSNLTSFPDSATEVPFESNPDISNTVFPVICKALQGEYATACLALSKLKHKEDESKNINLVAGMAINEVKDFVIDKIYHTSLKRFNEQFDETYELIDIDIYSEHLFVSQPFGVATILLVW